MQEGRCHREVQGLFFGIDYPVTTVFTTEKFNLGRAFKYPPFHRKA